MKLTKRKRNDESKQKEKKKCPAQDRDKSGNGSGEFTKAELDVLSPNPTRNFRHPEEFSCASAEILRGSAGKGQMKEVLPGTAARQGALVFDR